MLGMGLSRVMLCFFTVLTLGIAVSSLAWRMDVDSPLMLYAAWLMNHHHYVPYRDLFDMNMPGTYLINCLIGGIFGYGDLGFRVVDLLLLLVISSATFRFMKLFGRSVAWTACVVFALAYLTGGPAITMQREYFVISFLTLAVAVILEPGPLSRAVRCLLVGLLAGLAATVKPHSALAFSWFVVFLNLPLSGSARELGARGRQTLLLFLGFGVPIAATVLYLLLVGAWQPFLEIARNYWPLYGSLDGRHIAVSGFARVNMLLEGMKNPVGIGLWLIPAVAGASLTLSAFPEPSRERTRLTLLLGLAVGFGIYPIFSGQFWPYHFLPACYFLILLGSLWLRERAGNRAPSKLVVGAFWLIVLLMTSVPGQLLDDISGASRNPHDGRVDEVARFLEKRLRPGDRVQPLDWAAGAVHSLLLAKARLATEFMYDFHFYHHVSTPYIAGLRRRFMSELRASSPRFLVAIDDSVLPTGPDTSRVFPDLNSFIETHYLKVANGDRYAIYERR
jgi:hypothetical protein